MRTRNSKDRGFGVAVALLLIGSLCSCNSNSHETAAVTTKRQSFQADLSGMVSRDAGLRKKAFSRFQSNWTTYRNHLGKLGKGASLSKRIAAAYLLGRLGTKEDLASIRACLQDEEFQVRVAALRGVRRLNDWDGLQLVLKRGTQSSYEDLVIGMQVAYELDPEEAERRTYELAEHSRWQARRVAAQFMGRLESPRSTKVLLQLIEDEVWCVLLDACESAGKRRLVAAKAPLRKLLRHLEWPVRAAAIKALGRLGLEEDLKNIWRVSHEDSEKKVRIAAVESLEGYPEEPAVKCLASVLERPGEHYKVKKAAVRRLLGMQGGEAQALLQKLRANGSKEMQELLSSLSEQQDAKLVAPTPPPPQLPVTHKSAGKRHASGGIQRHGSAREN